MTAQIITLADYRRPAPAPVAFRAASLTAALWLTMGAVMLLWWCA